MFKTLSARFIFLFRIDFIPQFVMTWQSPVNKTDMEPIVTRKSLKIIP